MRRGYKMNRDAHALAYFKENSGYRRIFQGIYNRYRSLGRLGGTVTIRNLTPDEKEVLSSHLRRDYSRKKSASFTVKDFEESLQYTRFASYSLKEILQWYFGVDLISKAEEEQKFYNERKSFFERLLEVHRGEPGEAWIEAILREDGVGIRRIMTAYSQDKEQLAQEIEWVCAALKRLENREGGLPWRLPVLASYVTRDPHAFDRGNPAGEMLIDALCIVHGFSSPLNQQETAELLYKSGILIDEISNYITLSGLLAYKSGRLHSVWKAAMEEGEVLQVPLANLVQINRITSPTGRVFVVENPAVFSSILDEFDGEGVPPLICSYGHIKLAGLLVLDKLAKEGTEIYYSGDFDPEGLLIADKLTKRYNGRLNLWHYGIKDYTKTLSEHTLSSKRLSMLGSIKTPALQDVAKEMLVLKRSGYQELLLDELVKDINK